MKCKVVVHRLLWSELWNLSGRSISSFMFLVPVKLFKQTSLDREQEVREKIDAVELSIDLVERRSLGSHRILVDAGFDYCFSEERPGGVDAFMDYYSGEKGVVVSVVSDVPGASGRFFSILSLLSDGGVVATANGEVGMRGAPRVLKEYCSGVSIEGLLSRHLKRVSGSRLSVVDDVEEFMNELAVESLNFNLERGVYVSIDSEPGAALNAAPRRQ